MTATSYAALENAALSAKVRAVNDANAHANALNAQIRAALAPFVGKKVKKADGSLTEAVKSALPRVLSVPGILQVFESRYERSLEFVVKACVPYAQTCVYFEAHAVIGKIDRGILTGFWDVGGPLRADWTLEEVTALRAASETAHRAARDAEAACGPFLSAN